jgi:hypothetical protein
MGRKPGSLGRALRQHVYYTLENINHSSQELLIAAPGWLESSGLFWGRVCSRVSSEFWTFLRSCLLRGVWRVLNFFGVMSAPGCKGLARLDKGLWGNVENAYLSARTSTRASIHYSFRRHPVPRGRETPLHSAHRGDLAPIRLCCS